MIRRRRAEIALLSLVIVIGGIVVRNNAVRHHRTREAFATTGALQTEMRSRGCARVAVLPMLDFEDLSVRQVKGSRTDALLAVCELAPNATYSDSWADDLKVSSDTQVLLKHSDGSTLFMFHVPTHGRVIAVSVLGKHLVVMHQPKPAPWYWVPIALAWRAWQNIAYR